MRKFYLILGIFKQKSHLISKIKSPANCHFLIQVFFFFFKVKALADFKRNSIAQSFMKKTLKGLCQCISDCFFPHNASETGDQTKYVRSEMIGAYGKVPSQNQSPQANWMTPEPPFGNASLSPDTTIASSSIDSDNRLELNEHSEEPTHHLRAKHEILNLDDNEFEETKIDVPEYSNQEPSLKKKIKDLAEEKLSELAPKLSESLQNFVLSTKSDENPKVYTLIFDHFGGKSHKKKKLVVYRMSYEIEATIPQYQYYTVNVNSQKTIGRMEDIHEIETFEYEDGAIIHLCYMRSKKLSVIVSSRDFVFIKMVKEVGNFVYEVTRSVKHPRYPKDPSGKVVRAKIISNILRYTPIDGNIKTAKRFLVDTYNITDAKIPVPPQVYKSIVVKEMAEFANFIQKEISSGKTPNNNFEPKKIFKKT